MPSSKNPREAIDVPEEIIKLSRDKKGITCNLRIGQYSLKGKTESEIRRWQIEMMFNDTWNFHKDMEIFFRNVQPKERIILLCQGFGADIFSLITDVEDIFWFNDYPRIDFEKRPRIVRKIFGDSNLWGGFVLAAAKVGRVKQQAALGYDLLFQIAKRPGGIKN
ncbi:MAG: hypothetical protein PF549_02930 [Patescibacteria group bacterium]|nr:hypothetical protein [Patescibacteria group bacterium]